MDYADKGDLSHLAQYNEHGKQWGQFIKLLTGLPSDFKSQGESTTALVRQQER